MYNQFGNFLFELRKDKGLTQTQLADMLNLTNKAVSKWETGETFPETAQLLPLARIFNVSIDELLNGGRNTTTETEDKTEKQNHKNIAVFKLFCFKLVVSIAIIIAGITTLLLHPDASYINEKFVSVCLGCIAVGVAFYMHIGIMKYIESVSPTYPIIDKGRKIVFTLSAGIVILIVSPMSLFLSRLPLDYATTEKIVFFIILFMGLTVSIVFGILLKKFFKAYLKDSYQVNDGKRVITVEMILEMLVGFIILIANILFIVWDSMREWEYALIVCTIGGFVCGLFAIIKVYIKNRS